MLYLHRQDKDVTLGGELALECMQHAADLFNIRWSLRKQTLHTENMLTESAHHFLIEANRSGMMCRLCVYMCCTCSVLVHAMQPTAQLVHLTAIIL